MPLKYRIEKDSFNEITMKARAWIDNKEIEVWGTYDPYLSWYDTVNRRWINQDEWSFVF